MSGQIVNVLTGAVEEDDDIVVLPTPQPAEPAFPPLEAWQFHAVLDISGLRPAIVAAIDVMEEPDRTITRSRLDYTRTFYRDDPLFDLVGLQAGIPPEQVDDLWLYAASMSAR